MENDPFTVDLPTQMVIFHHFNGASPSTSRAVHPPEVTGPFLAPREIENAKLSWGELITPIS